MAALLCFAGNIEAKGHSGHGKAPASKSLAKHPAPAHVFQKHLLQTQP